LYHAIFPDVRKLIPCVNENFIHVFYHGIGRYFSPLAVYHFPGFQTYQPQSTSSTISTGFHLLGFPGEKNCHRLHSGDRFLQGHRKINASIHSGMNYICCHCDIRVSSFTSKSGAQIQQQEHIVNDLRIFSEPKSLSSSAIASHSDLPDPLNTITSPILDCSTSEAVDLDDINTNLPS
jgi:hypothetical protein